MSRHRGTYYTGHFLGASYQMPGGAIASPSDFGALGLPDVPMIYRRAARRAARNARLSGLHGMGDCQVFDDGSMICDTAGGDLYSINAPSDVISPYGNAGGSIINSSGVLTQNGPTVTGGSASVPINWNQIAQNARDLGVTLIGLNQQQALARVNLERAQRGLPIISPSSIAPTMNFGLSQDTMMWIGGGLLLLVLLTRGKSH